jgi:membrane-associated protein
MESLQKLVDLFLHIDDHVKQVVADYGTLTYVILFVIVFCETGLVVTPFLPGDSLLFAAGVVAGDEGSGLNIYLLTALLWAAAVLGDAANYAIGHYLGPRVLSGNHRFLKREYLERTQRFYDRYGGKTIVLARFVPIVRTFAPFLAGVGAMTYPRFLVYNVFGATLWVGIFLWGGYLFGGYEIVQNNFELVVIAIIAVSLLPGVIGYLQERRRLKSETKNAT